MTHLSEFLRSNLVVVQFLYGLIFFALGVAIVVQPRRNSIYDLARQLDWLAVFGFAHAFSDWGNLFIPLQAAWAPPETVAVFWVLRACTAALSFAALLYFGVSLLVHPNRRKAWFLLPAFQWSLWLMIFIVQPLITQSVPMGEALNLAQSVFRYVAGLPGALLTAAALWAQAGALQSESTVKHVRYLKAAAVGFVLYGFTAGLIVPQQSFFPASFLNKNTFFDVFGIPVELVRGAIMTFILYFTVRLMDVFNVETQRRLQRAEQERALLREREQIARELHDGIMQTLYGTGLGLKQVAKMASANPALASAITSELSQEIGRSIVQMRRFVLDLKDEGTTPAEIAGEVRSFCAQVGQDGEFPVTVQTEGCTDAHRKMPGGLREDVMAVVREGLAAAMRRDKVSSASVVVSLDENAFLIRVSNQGAGTIPADSASWEGLQERIEGAGGLVHALINEGQDPLLVAHLPVSRGSRPRPIREGVES